MIETLNRKSSKKKKKNGIRKGLRKHVLFKCQPARYLSSEIHVFSLYIASAIAAIVAAFFNFS